MTLVRRLVDRVFPRGALVLSILTFGYFAMGIVRNRALATTFGAGPELDAYNAAFKIPEIALDVLVAAGLTAPFVPIFNGLRQRDEGAAHDFGRTVLTAAVLVMSVVILILFVVAPQTVGFVASGFDDSTRALYVDLFRLMCVTPILFAASIVVLILFLVAPQTVGIIASGFDEPTRALYVDLFRLMCVTPILFAASIAIGEVHDDHKR
jgi:putative peptidoglycan lipid II flippase